MGEGTITRSKAVTLINDSIENFFTYYDSYCCENRDAISEDEKKLHEELCDVIYILRNDADYANDLKIMPLKDLKEFLYMCKEMVENNDLLAKTFYPKGNIVIVEDYNTNPELIEKSLKILEQHGDERIKTAIRDYHDGERKILFSKMPKNQYGKTECKNESYLNYLSEELNHDSPENQVRVAVTLAHEFRRNATSDSVDGETRNIILEDTKIIESFANAYGEGIYKKFPEYGILHYIKKIFGETGLKEFADYAFDSTGSYWKVNEAGDLIDDVKSSRVADSKGNELYSGTKGLQGTLQEWLGMENAYASLMQPAGFEWDGRQWSKNPGKIDHSVIEKAHNEGQLTDDQYNLIQLAAGKSASDDDKAEKINLFRQFFNDYQQANVIKTQAQVDIANRAWEWINNKVKYVKEKIASKKNLKKDETQIINSFKELMETVTIEDLSSPCCDLYSTRVLEIINKKTADWPSPSTYKVCNTPNYTGNNYKDFYSSQWKTSPSEGWNVMIMWANSGEKFENSPHMAIVQKKDNTFNLTHFTGNEQKIRENWSLAQVENGFDYSNFRYMSLGK